jgi:hypothetical protein
MRPLRAALLLFAAACDGVDIERETLTDVGSACLGESGEIQMDYEVCLSSSCDDLVSTDCNATLDGNTLTIANEISIDHKVGHKVECTADCGMVLTICGGESVDSVDGITVVIGEASEPLQACPTE